MLAPATAATPTVNSFTYEIVSQAKGLACMMDAMSRSHTEISEAAVALRHSVTRFFRVMRRRAESGLTPSQLAALATVSRSGPLPIGRLAEEEGIAAPTATKVVDKLVSAGLVERGADPRDRRVTLLSTTAEGRALIDEVRARRTAWLTERLGELDDADFDTILAAARVLEHLMTAETNTNGDPRADASGLGDGSTDEVAVDENDRDEQV